MCACKTGFLLTSSRAIFALQLSPFPQEKIYEKFGSFSWLGQKVKDRLMLYTNFKIEKKRQIYTFYYHLIQLNL